jgi:hypothetical protein
MGRKQSRQDLGMCLFQAMLLQELVSNLHWIVFHVVAPIKIAPGWAALLFRSAVNA